MKKFFRKMLNATGFDIVRTRNQHGSFELHLRQLFLDRKIDCVIDVGANTGQYGSFLRGLGYDGWIVSFEPAKSVFDKLVEKSIRDDKWLCFNFALGDKTEKKILNVYGSTDFSSFLEANDYSKNIWNLLSSVTHEEVPVVKLDDIFHDMSQKQIVKTTISRWILKVMILMYFVEHCESLYKIDALQTELSLIHIYNNMGQCI